MNDKIMRVIAAIVAVAALVGVNFELVDVDTVTTTLTNAGAAVLLAYAALKNVFAKYFGGGV